MSVHLTSEEQLLIRATLEREAHVQDEFASAPGVLGTTTAASFTARAAAARGIIAKLDAAALETFKASLDLPGDEGPGPCGGCGSHAHRVVDGERSWVECTHGCGWSTKALR